MLVLGVKERVKSYWLRGKEHFRDQEKDAKTVTTNLKGLGEGIAQSIGNTSPVK